MVTIRDILRLLNEGKALATIAEEVGIDKTTLHRRFTRKFGYRYNKETGKWDFIGQGEEPLDKEISVKQYRTNGPDLSSNTDITFDNPAVTSGNAEVISQFTSEEVSVLKLMIAERAAAKDESAENALFKRLRSLRKSEATRKTFVLGKDVGHTLDEFAAQNRVDKSDILTMALQDFFERYEKSYSL